MVQIIVTKKEEEDNKTVFDVVAKEDDGETSHMVSLKKEYYKELTDGKITPEELIVRSFEFLLERESKESILPEFDLKVISQYFPEYEDEICLPVGRSETSEILLIDKPKGITSFDVIRKLRKKLGIRKMGHAGTLDPLATGLLIIGIGDSTKKLKDLIGLSKQYEVEILLGLQTDTGDMEGKVVKSLKIEKLESSTIKKVIKGMVGKLKLLVPAYSAIKQGGESLYKKARRGEKVNVPIREMEIYNIELHGYKLCDDGYILEITMDVSSGTYVRSIAEEIGKRLGVPATVRQLRRTKVGEYSIENAESIE